MSLSGDDEVWDGSRSTDHYSNSYLKEDQVTAYDGTLYDSATWNHYHDYGQVRIIMEKLRSIVSREPLHFWQGQILTIIIIRLNRLRTVTISYQ